MSHLTDHGGAGLQNATPDKPLHVRVAEALGCTPREIPYRKEPGRSWWTCGCERLNHPHNNNDDGPADTHLKEYDTDWSATGPLIEKYGIGLDPHLFAPIPADHWIAHDRQNINTLVNGCSATGPTPLIAVCNLILVLKESGKLEGKQETPP